MDSNVNVRNLDSKTSQEVFDFVANHLLTQGRKSMRVFDNMFVGDPYSGSVTNTVECAYLADDGCKCAAGCLIPSDLYNPRFEGVDWEGLVYDSNWSKSHVNLIMDLQTVHDKTDPRDWGGRLRIVANTHGLNQTVINEYEAAQSN